MGRKAHEKAVAQWMERDLTAAALAGELAPAFEIEETLHQVLEIITSGKHPVLVGPSGVGKTAIIHELIRRATAGRGPSQLENRRVLQFSLRHRAAALKTTDLMRPNLQKLMTALHEFQDTIVPFFRDFHLAYSFDIESQFQALGFRFPGVILAEGVPTEIMTMFEYEPDLHENYVILNVEEPSLERTACIMNAWAAEQAKEHSNHFSKGAREEALHLGHRFLARAHLPRKALDLLVQVASLREAGSEITAVDVIDRFCRNHRVPRALVDPAIPLDLGELQKRFSDRVLGQPEAVRGVIQMVGLIKAGLSDVRRPFGVFLFVGPTGVGKTHLAQLLAEYLFGSADRLLRLNMADYPKEVDAALLFGIPEANSLPLKRGVLTQRIAGHPFAGLLLDEFEKTHTKVHDRFLQLFDEGVFINGAGETISCRSMILIATTNAGAEVYRGHALGFAGLTDLQTMVKEVDRRLSQHFRFEFLNRFDQVIHFHPLTREHIRTIALRELEKLKERGGLTRHGYGLEVDESVLDWLTAHGYDPHYGARFLRRTIERHVTTAIAEVVVQAGGAEGCQISLGIHHNQVTAQLVENPVAAPRRQTVVLPFGSTEHVVTLDRSALLATADRTLTSAQKRLANLEKKQEEASHILETMNKAGFWERTDENRELLDRYREFDVVIQQELRWAEPILRLPLLKEELHEGRITLSTFARGVEAAAEALKEWDSRLAEEGAGAMWMVLSTVDPLLPTSDWLAELTEMELRWCQKLGLSAAVVAYDAAELARVILEVEGLGAESHLAMEEGIHRLHRNKGGDLRVRVALIPKLTASSEVSLHASQTKHRRGRFNLEIECSCRLELADRGLVMELVGTNQETLSLLVSDLRQAWKAPQTERVEVARLYGQDGAGARDPRTGVTLSRLKEVMRGELDKFLDAWRVRDAG